MHGVMNEITWICSYVTSRVDGAIACRCVSGYFPTSFIVDEQIQGAYSRIKMQSLSIFFINKQAARQQTYHMCFGSNGDGTRRVFHSSTAEYHRFIHHAGKRLQRQLLIHTYSESNNVIVLQLPFCFAILLLLFDNEKKQARDMEWPLDGVGVRSRFAKQCDILRQHTCKKNMYRFCSGTRIYVNLYVEH